MYKGGKQVPRLWIEFQIFPRDFSDSLSYQRFFISSVRKHT